MHFSSHLEGTAKAKKDEHEVEYWINSPRNGNVRVSTAKPSFQFALYIKLFYSKLWQTCTVSCKMTTVLC